MRIRKAEALLFSKKGYPPRESKTFRSGGLWRQSGHSPHLAQVFLLLFFQKKKRFLTYSAATRAFWA
jgi:hypothetical protein